METCLNVVGDLLLLSNDDNMKIINDNRLQMTQAVHTSSLLHRISCRLHRNICTIVSAQVLNADITVDLQLHFIKQLQPLLLRDSLLRMLVVNFCHAKCRASTDLSDDLDPISPADVIQMERSDFDATGKSSDSESDEDAGEMEVDEVEPQKTTTTALSTTTKEEAQEKKKPLSKTMCLPIYAKMMHLIIQLARESGDAEFVFDFSGCTEP